MQTLNLKDIATVCFITNQKTKGDYIMIIKITADNFNDEVINKNGKITKEFVFEGVWGIYRKICL